MATLLIVDDDRNLVEQLAARLTPMGYRCYVETTAERAIRLLDELNVELLLLDVMLPGMSGFQLCRRIRANPAHHGLPILFMSAMDSEEEVAHGLAQGADDFVTKPFKIEVLVKHIESLLASTGKNNLTDPVTSLSNAKCIKLAVQKAIHEKTSFSLAYMELMRIGEFGRVLGMDARNKALRHFSRLLNICAEEVEPKIFQAGHLGGGHYVCMLDPEHVQTYSKRVLEGWERHLPKLYSDLGQEKAYQQALARSSKTAHLPLLEALICITHHDASSSITSLKHFEILSHLRQSAIESRGPGIFEDRRH